MNTFQLVIASDRRNSFAFFHYPEGGLQWLRGQGKTDSQAPDVPGQAGFDAGDGARSFRLPRSGNPEVANLERYRVNILNVTRTHVELLTGRVVRWVCVVNGSILL